MQMKYNPFNPNSVVSSNLFAGRKEYVLRILRKLEQVKRGMPSSFFIFGERGIGKTALAKLVMYVAEQKDKGLGDLDMLVSYYSVDKGQSIGSVMQSSMNELTDKIPQSILSSLQDKLGSLLNKGKFTIGSFSVEMRSQGEQSTAIKDQLISILSNIITAFENTKEEKRRRDGILIVIDELHNVADIELCAQLFRGIITTLDVKNLGKISFFLIGYDYTLNDFFKSDVSARRQFDSVKLDVMPVNEAKEVLIKGFEEVNVTWDQPALDHNIIITGGYPHSIQLLGHNLIECDKDNIVDEDDWKQAISITARDLQNKEFAEMYDFRGKVSGRERILDALAVAGRSLSKKELEKYSGVKNVYQYVSDLVKRGSIKADVETGNIFLHSHLLGTAIILKIIDKIKTEGYLKELIAETNGKRD